VTDTSLRKWYGWFTALGLLVGVLVVVGYYRDEYREWKDYQRKYIQEEIRRAATPQAKDALAERIPVEVRQIVLPELNRVDRCTTCHIAVEDPSYGGYPQPLSYHPLHEQHPFEKFGCTICHRGQGRATTTVTPTATWRTGTSRCCRWNTSRPPAANATKPLTIRPRPELAQGEQVFETSGCRGCHKLGGTGGIIGPELDKVGARRSPEWLKKHFIAPASATPGSVMPPQKFSETGLRSHRALHAQPDRRIGRRLLLLHESSAQYPRGAALVPKQRLLRLPLCQWQRRQSGPALGRRRPSSRSGMDDATFPRSAKRHPWLGHAKVWFHRNRSPRPHRFSHPHA
jgi:cytochrome c551/c552